MISTALVIDDPITKFAWGDFNKEKIIMAVQKIKDDIFYVGARDWDRRLFDELIPLPEGTSYNSYLIKGSEKTALIDAVDPEKAEILLKNLEELQVTNLDYVIANHGEQDHSGSIVHILEKFPEAKVVTNAKCKSFLMDLLHIAEKRFITVAEGETVSLGNKTLEFYLTPWVHWPETQMTYLKEDKIAFTCDFFGSHLATSDLFVTDESHTYFSAKRYYAEIMMPFRQQIKKNIEKVEKLDISIIAPSHGPLYKNPSFIIDAYKEWISDSVKKEVVLPYVSMHESTKIMVDYIIKSLIEKGIKVIPFNLSVADLGELTMSMVEASSILIACPMVLAGPHPAAVQAAYLVNAIRPKTKHLAIVGSYGWGGKLTETLLSLLSNIKGEVLDPVLVKGKPRKEDLEKLEGLVQTLAEKINAL